MLISLFIIFAKSKRFMVKLMRQQQWLLATLVLYVRALLNFLAVSNTALSFAVAIQSMDIYNGHRALVGIYSLLSTTKRFARLKPYLAIVHGSLLLWILYAMALWAGNYALVLGELFTTDISTKSKLIAGIRKVHDSLETTGFSRNRVNDAVDVISTVALHVLVEEIRRSEIIITLLGPVTVVDGILFAAKSLGTFVIRPEQLLQWLDYASPPPVLAWGIFSAQLASNSLGAIWGLSTGTGLLSALERVLVVYGVLVTIPLVFMHRRLPPPYENRDWNMALNSRHRLLFLIPELDSGVRSKLHFVIKFFERYEKAYSSTTNTWTSSVAWVDRKWASVHAWVQKNVTQRLQVSNGEEAAEYQFVQESEVSICGRLCGNSGAVSDLCLQVPYKDEIDEDNQNTHYSRVLRYLRNKQHTNMLEMEKEKEKQLQLEVELKDENKDEADGEKSAVESSPSTETTSLETPQDSPTKTSWTEWVFGTPSKPSTSSSENNDKEDVVPAEAPVEGSSGSHDELKDNALSQEVSSTSVPVYDTDIEEEVSAVMKALLARLEEKQIRTPQSEWAKLSRFTRFYYRVRGRNEKDHFLEVAAEAQRVRVSSRTSRSSSKSSCSSSKSFSLPSSKSSALENASSPASELALSAEQEEAPELLSTKLKTEDDSTPNSFHSSAAHDSQPPVNPSSNLSQLFSNTSAGDNCSDEATQVAVELANRIVDDLVSQLVDNVATDGEENSHDGTIHLRDNRHDHEASPSNTGEAVHSHSLSAADSDPAVRPSVNANNDVQNRVTAPASTRTDRAKSEGNAESCCINEEAEERAQCGSSMVDQPGATQADNGNETATSIAAKPPTRAAKDEQKDVPTCGDEKDNASSPSYSSSAVSSPEADANREPSNKVGAALAEMEVSAPRRRWTEHGINYLNKLWKAEPDVIELQEMERTID